jgi:hypothetical protein
MAASAAYILCSAGTSFMAQAYAIQADVEIVQTTPIL